MHHGVHSWKRVHGWKTVHGTIEKEQAECVHPGVHGQKRVPGWKRVHSTIEKEQVELTRGSACVIWGGAKMRASRGSRSIKSSQLEKSS